VLKVKRPLSNSLPRHKKTSGEKQNSTKRSSDLADFPGVTNGSSSSEQVHAHYTIDVGVTNHWTTNQWTGLESKNLFLHTVVCNFHK